MGWGGRGWGGARFIIHHTLTLAKGVGALLCWLGGSAIGELKSGTLINLPPLLLTLVNLRPQIDRYHPTLENDSEHIFTSKIVWKNENHPASFLFLALLCNHSDQSW